ncbi:MAG: hypothetical protein IPO55_07900 [Alphaproteobacteria bacterium]|nr:hypothetical protein [Alphaproteobacteria bacterium]
MMTDKIRALEAEIEEKVALQFEMERIRMRNEADEACKKAFDDGYRRGLKDVIPDLIRVEAEIERRDKGLRKHYSAFRDELQKIIKSHEAKI